MTQQVKGRFLSENPGLMEMFHAKNQATGEEIIFQCTISRMSVIHLTIIC